MTRRRAALTWIAFLATAVAGLDAHAQVKEILYEGPAEATEPQLQKAVKALAARCEAYAIKGVTGALAGPDPKAPKRIRLTCPTGFAEESLESIDFLASFPASKLDLRIIHKRGQAEEEKHPVESKAYEGSSWVKIVEWERVETTFQSYRKADQSLTWLFRDMPILDASGKLKVLRHAGGTYKRNKLDAGLYLEFSKDVTQALYRCITKDPDEPAQDVLLIAIILDGIKLETGGGVMRWLDSSQDNKSKVPDIALWSIQELAESKVLPFLLGHPLPFALTRVD